MLPGGWDLAHAIRLGIKPFAEWGANSEALSGSQVDSPCSCRAIFESAPVAMLQSRIFGVFHAHCGDLYIVFHPLESRKSQNLKGGVSDLPSRLRIQFEGAIYCVMASASPSPTGRRTSADHGTDRAGNRKPSLTSRQEARERRIVGSLKPFRWNPAGNQSRPVEPDQQPEASLAWWVGDHPYEA